MRRIPGIAALLACAAFAFAGSVWAQKTTLLVYTALETDQLKAYQEGFNKSYPDIELKWVRDSTGAELLTRPQGRGLDGLKRVHKERRRHLGLETNGASR
jgi:ABC-type glycerol-3-phosphate transport system substrate-binding protein